MACEVAAAYKSGSQRTRVITEAWAAQNLYCPSCPSPSLTRLTHNTRASDFACPQCKLWYQLKGQQSRIGNSVPDGAYAAMIAAIRKDETPNFYLMQYDLETWNVRNLLLIPHFAFPTSAVIKRKPLSLSARRAGWIGCNIALTRIPVDARISVVLDCREIPETDVRKQYRRVKPLENLSVAQRGWTLDVLNAVRSLNKIEFTNDDVYALVPHFEKLHPGNRHVRDKIRQQLQVLRDAKLLLHVEKGLWRIAATEVG